MKKTKLSFKLLALTFLLHALAVSPASAGAPLKINFQGRLDQSGQPAEGTKTFVFKIYDAVSGGTPLWTGDSQAIALSGGVFSAVLSAGTPAALSTATFSGARYVEMVVDGVTLAPRQEMVSAPYALVAQALAPDAVIPASPIIDGSVTDAKVLLSTAAISFGKFGDDRVEISTSVISGLGAMALAGAEADPVFTASAAAAITVSSTTDWNEAYGWGNHSTTGYETTAAHSADLAAYAALAATQAFTGANTFISSAAFTFQHGSDPGVNISSGLVVAAGRTGIGTASPNSVLSVNGAMSLPIKTITYGDSPYPVTDADSTVLIDGYLASDDIEVTLPSAVGKMGRLYTFKRMDDMSGAYSVFIVPQAGEVIDMYDSGSPLQLSYMQYESVTVQSNGSNWVIVGWFWL